MSGPVGVPLEGGQAGALHERASATPARPPVRIEETARRPPVEHRNPLLIPLRALQEWFTSAVLHPGGISASLRESAATARVTEDDLERLVQPSATLSGAERVAIYREAYRSRLVECLADDYPTVKHALGEEDFDAACLAYIDRYPSRSPSLNFYGRGMASFLRGWSHPHAAFAADLAAIEWALVEVLHAGAAQRLSHEALSVIPLSRWPAARMVPSPTVRLLELGHPANAYFQEFRQGHDPAVPQPRWSATAVYRDGATLWRMELNRSMHVLLRELFAGRTLGEAVEALAAEESANEQQGSQVMQWFREWIEHGFFAQIVVPSG
jgi:hypothetical protein